jgi:hypothetical protein
VAKGPRHQASSGDQKILEATEVTNSFGPLVSSYQSPQKIHQAAILEGIQKIDSIRKYKF